MAIQIGGTTVIDNSRNLTNVGGLKTVGGTSILGSGDIATGGSTTFGDVGTYLYGRPENTTSYAAGSTASGVKAVKGSSLSYDPRYYGAWTYLNTSYATSGTWRAMMGTPQEGSNHGCAIWVRIS